MTTVTLFSPKENATQSNMVTYSDFTALGQPRLAVFSNGVRTDYDYYPETGRLKSLTTTKPPGGTLYQKLFHDVYDEKGNIKTITERDINRNPLLTHNYSYDALDRLETATGTGTSPYSLGYQYDRIGNIISKSDVGTYTYDYGNKPHAVRSVVAALPIYNNLPEIRIDYSFDQKPILIQKKSGENWVDYVRFTYDGGGQRIKKENLEAPDTTLYFGELYETRNGTGIVHLFAGSRRVASVWLDANRNPQFTQFYHPDHLGSTNVVTEQNGNRAERLGYYPVGTYRGNVDDNSGFPDVYYTYTGQEEDFDLEFYNYKARLYDPVLGRFVSPDPVDPDPEDPQTLNRYAYVLNNPLRYIDPTGHQYESYDPYMWVNSTYNEYGFGVNLIDFRQMAVQRSIVDFGLHSSRNDYSLTSYKSVSDTSISTYYGPPLSSLNSGPLPSNSIETIEAVNNIATGVCIGLTCTPSGVTNVIGAGGLILTSAVGLGVDFYEAYVTESRGKSDFYINAAATVFTTSAGVTVTRLTGTAAKYSYTADRFYTINPSGTWRFVETEVGKIGIQIKAGFSAVGTFLTNSYRTYLP